MTDTHSLELQLESRAPDVPSQSEIEHWVNSVLEYIGRGGDITVRIVDREESATLNETYRKKQGPTNVLSFPVEPIEGYDLLGDIVVCAPIVIEQARAQDKGIRAHWAHLIVHGILHLLGYNHMDAEDAKQMESLEVTILTKLGFNNPYILR